MKGVLLVNLGSPDSPDRKDVKKYLGQFLMDERVIDEPLWLRTLLVKGIILNTRPRKSAKAYQKIWWDEGSPLIVLSNRLLEKVNDMTSIPISLAMRYGNPSIESGISELYKKGVKLIQFDTNNKNFFNLKLLLKKIYSLGCRNLLVEGGKTLTNSFLKHNIFNQFYLFQSSNKFGKTAKLNVYSELNQLSYKYKKKSKLNSFTGDDIIYLYSK